MLIFGHPWVESPRFVKVFSLEDIARTQQEDILLLEPLSVSIDLVKHCQKNDLQYAVTVNTVREAILANALKAAHVMCQYDHAITIQKVAEEYLFDTKILVLVEKEAQIESVARFGIDGVIFPNAIIQK